MPKTITVVDLIYLAVITMQVILMVVLCRQLRRIRRRGDDDEVYRDRSVR
jgi:hypothetical protein